MTLCNKAKPGWFCSRTIGHDGPCAAHLRPGDATVDMTKVGANSRQVGGDHYKEAGKNGEEHWDRVARLGLDYFQGCITKYVERWKKKGGIQDLEKARHYLDKYIEVETARTKHESERVSTPGEENRVPPRTDP